MSWAEPWREDSDGDFKRRRPKRKDGPTPLVALPNPSNGNFIDGTTPTVRGRQDRGFLAQGERKIDIITEGGESDWFRVDLRANVPYVFEQRQAIPNQGDPKLRLYDPRGSLVHDPAISDDAGGGTNSRLQFMPTESGTFFFAAAGFAGTPTAYEIGFFQV